MTKTHVKERTKSIYLIFQCYNRRFELLKFGPQINEIKEYIDSIIKKEKELIIKETILEADREGTKLSWTELRSAVNDNAVF
jgi:hypothetical protein